MKTLKFVCVIGKGLKLEKLRKHKEG